MQKTPEAQAFPGFFLVSHAGIEPATP